MHRPINVSPCANGKQRLQHVAMWGSGGCAGFQIKIDQDCAVLMAMIRYIFAQSIKRGHAPPSVDIQVLLPASLFVMEKHSTALIEQLQSVHARQRKVIQQLQADNARLLSDLADIRRERDSFRAEAAKLRKEQAELHNQLDETLSEYQDLKRERLTLARTFSNASSFARPLKTNHKVRTRGS